MTSGNFWDDLYREGGTSGAGSVGRLADFKAEIINEFVESRDIRSVVELGCGDGHQLSLMNYPSYVGLDVSQSAVQRCKRLFEGDTSKRFGKYEPGVTPAVSCDLALSLDVIYHLLEEESFDDYMKSLFNLAERFVIIYSNDSEKASSWWEVRNWKFSSWVSTNAPDWTLADMIPQRYPYDPSNESETSWSDFFIYERSTEIG